MNIALWCCQIALALLFLGAGTMKLVKSKGALERQNGFGYVTERTASEMKLIGLAEVLGAAGLIVPWSLGIVHMLTPVAAAGLALLMIGAIATHRRRHESILFVSALFVLLIFIAIGRANT